MTIEREAIDWYAENMARLHLETFGGYPNELRICNGLVIEAGVIDGGGAGVGDVIGATGG